MTIRPHPILTHQPPLITVKGVPLVQSKTTYIDLFGRSLQETTPQQRRENWDEYVGLIEHAARRCPPAAARTLRAIIEAHQDCEHQDCRHFCSGWCELQGLPAGFNPVMRTTGMACMGMGYEPHPSTPGATP